MATRRIRPPRDLNRTTDEAARTEIESVSSLLSRLCPPYSSRDPVLLEGMAPPPADSSSLPSEPRSIGDAVVRTLLAVFGFYRERAWGALLQQVEQGSLYAMQMARSLRLYPYVAHRIARQHHLDFFVTAGNQRLQLSKVKQNDSRLKLVSCLESLRLRDRLFLMLQRTKASESPAVEWSNATQEILNSSVAACDTSVLLVSASLHERYTQIGTMMGLPPSNVQAIAADNDGVMSTADLQTALCECSLRGRSVLAVVASLGGGMPTGFDPLNDLVRLRSEHELQFGGRFFLHVEASPQVLFGAALRDEQGFLLTCDECFSHDCAPHRQRTWDVLSALPFADTISLPLPSLEAPDLGCAALLCRHTDPIRNGLTQGAHATTASVSEANYLERADAGNLKAAIAWLRIRNAPLHSGAAGALALLWSDAMEDVKTRLTAHDWLDSNGSSVRFLPLPQTAPSEFSLAIADAGSCGEPASDKVRERLAQQPNQRNTAPGAAPQFEFWDFFSVRPFLSSPSSTSAPATAPTPFTQPTKAAVLQVFVPGHHAFLPTAPEPNFAEAFTATLVAHAGLTAPGGQRKGVDG